MHNVKNAEVKYGSGHLRVCSDSNKPLELQGQVHSMCPNSSKTGMIGSFSIKHSESPWFGLYPWVAKVLVVRETKLGQQEDWAT